MKCNRSSIHHSIYLPQISRLQHHSEIITSNDSTSQVDLFGTSANQGQERRHSELANSECLLS